MLLSMGRESSRREEGETNEEDCTSCFTVPAMAFAAGPQTFTGIITDSMCANADHKDMKMGNDAKCVVECVKGMNGKYVLYDAKAKKSYVLSDQKTPEKFAAKKGDRGGHARRCRQEPEGRFHRRREVAWTWHPNSTAPPAPGRSPTPWCAAIATPSSAGPAARRWSASTIWASAEAAALLQGRLLRVDAQLPRIGPPWLSRRYSRVL